METIRLQKFMADRGVCSRRKAEEYIKSGKVKVNGKVVDQIGIKVDTKKDKVEFQGKIIKNNEQKKKIYILLNKPIGYVTTLSDEHNRPTVLELLDTEERVVPVGRLDMYTSGALILTNDGDFVYKVTHPKHEIDKTYIVTIKGIIKQSEVKELENGVVIDEEKTKPATVKVLKKDDKKDITRLEIIIHEGKNRQIRKMCEAVNHKVLQLHRSKIGEIFVKNMNIGEWRFLKKEEVKQILKTKKS